MIRSWNDLSQSTPKIRYEGFVHNLYFFLIVMVIIAAILALGKIIHNVLQDCQVGGMKRKDFICPSAPEDFKVRY